MKHHATSGMIADLYGHLTAQAAWVAANSRVRSWTSAAVELVDERAARSATTLRQQTRDCACSVAPLVA